MMKYFSAKEQSKNIQKLIPTTSDKTSKPFIFRF